MGRLDVGTHRISREERDVSVVCFSERGDDDDTLGFALFAFLHDASHAHLTGMLDELRRWGEVKEGVAKLGVIPEE